MCAASVSAASRMVARVCWPLCSVRTGIGVSAIGGRAGAIKRTIVLFCRKPRPRVQQPCGISRHSTLEVGSSSPRHARDRAERRGCATLDGPWKCCNSTFPEDRRRGSRPSEAAVLYASDGVAWTLGDTFYVLRGGVQRRTGLQSRIEVHPIIAVRGAIPSKAWRQTPALSNPKLFARDRQVCAYWRPPPAPRRTDARAHRADLARRAGQLDELHHRLPALQRPQGNRLPRRPTRACLPAPTCPACTRT